MDTNQKLPLKMLLSRCIYLGDDHQKLLDPPTVEITLPQIDFFIYILTNVFYLLLH